MKRQVRLKISGKVQGVFFRAEACEEARKWGLKGWVRNTDDGGVETVAQGEENHLQHFVTWCHEGPPGARIEKVEIFQETPEEFSGFTIKY